MANLKLYGQERNLITSSIARMNLFLHGIEDFRIVRGDTLAEPALSKATASSSSMSSWPIRPTPSSSGTAKPGRRPVGPQLLGTPPQGRADYAFQQHIPRASSQDRPLRHPLAPRRPVPQRRTAMRASWSKPTWVECVSASVPTSSTTRPWKPASSSAACAKPKARRRNKVLFINAVNEVTRERAQSFLSKLRTRLDDLEAATRVTDLTAGNPHPLKGDRHRRFALDLAGGWRLVFAPMHDPCPVKDDQSIDWSRVTIISIEYIGDYHD
jgi:plasmid maintenance system killer protein